MTQGLGEQAKPSGSDTPQHKRTTRRAFLWMAGAGLASMVSMGAMGPGRPRAADGGTRKQSITQVQQMYGSDIMKLKGVVGHGIGLKGGEQALIIYVQDTAAQEYIDMLLADRIAGHPVRIEVTGEIMAQ